MRHFESLVLLCSVYLLTVFLGLHTATTLLPRMYPSPGVPAEIEPALGNPDSFWSTIQVIGYVIVTTAVMLYCIKRGWDAVISVSLLFSFLVGSSITFAAFVGDGIGFLLALVCLAIAMWKKNEVVVSNSILVFTLSGVGAYLGASLGLAPVIVLMVLASVYDYIAVFKTKHMVTLAKGIKGKFNMMFLVPVGDRVMGLGSGDIALPTTFIVSVYAAKGIGYAIPIAFCGLLGLVWLFYYLLDRRGVTLPALPPITAGLLIGYGLCLVLVP